MKNLEEKDAIMGLTNEEKNQTIQNQLTETL
jgi:hypothetical protein